MTFPNLVVLCGLPQSGKSTASQFLSEELGFSHISSDAIRKEYGMKWGTGDKRAKVVNHVVQCRSLEKLLLNENVVVDTTGMFAGQRALFLDLHLYAQRRLLPIHAKKHLLRFNISLETFKQRQQAAGRPTGQEKFFVDKFEEVSPQERSQVDYYAEFSSNLPEDIDIIRQNLAKLFSKNSKRP